MPGLSRPEIYRVVNDYIGGSGGYLGDFSYRSHAEFYPAYCDLDIDPYQLEGTTRDRFLRIISEATPDQQARIVRGVLAKYPVGSQQHRTATLFDEIAALAQRLEQGGVLNPALIVTSEVVERALKDAETLIGANGAASAIDRVHTALHGYVITVLDTENIEHPADASLTALYRLLRETHPAFQNDGPFSEEVQRVLRGFSSILDALNTLRNRASVAHPNPNLLPPEEAMLGVNVARTLLQYLDAKLVAFRG
jgi:hypothetical protein